MKQFDHILNWKLLRGCHHFPGPDGGTCINEAAIVAAGFKYRHVGHVGHMPECFSPVLSHYALCLNDRMPDGPRQGLLPFVGRLAGTNGSAVLEQERLEAIAVRIVTTIVPFVFEQPPILIRSDVLRDARDLASAFSFVEKELEWKSDACPLELVYLDRFHNLLRLFRMISARPVSAIGEGLRLEAAEWLSALCDDAAMRFGRLRCPPPRPKLPLPRRVIELGHLGPSPMPRLLSDVIWEHAIGALDAGIAVREPVAEPAEIVAERFEKAKASSELERA